MEGVFSAKINALNKELTRLRIHVEAAIDFPDEDTGFLEDAGIKEALTSLGLDIGNLRREAEQGALLQEGLTVVLAGKPNVGKSSLMNRLLGRDTAIVTAHPGTTRDVLHETLIISGVPIQLVDTAGLPRELQ